MFSRREDTSWVEEELGLRRRSSDKKSSGKNSAFLTLLVILLYIGFIVALVLWFSRADAQITPVQPDAIWMNIQVFDPDQGQKIITCTARQGVKYAWETTGFTVTAGCWVDQDRIFSGNFDLNP